MEEQSKTRKPKPKPRTNTSKTNCAYDNGHNKKQKKSEYEFCKVCNLNHDQGQRHKYFPSHKTSLSTFLSRFQSKLADVRFFLKNPCPLPSNLASRNRLWCVFCDSNIDELGCTFACYNAINHLASADHLKNLKHFLWKYGGAVDRLDAFRILESDVAKWEKKCKSLRNDDVLSTEGPIGPVLGPSHDIHNELNSGNIDSFENCSIQSVKSSHSNGVLPLQCYTNEYQVSHSGRFEVPSAGMYEYDAQSSLPAETCSGKKISELMDFRVNRNSQHALLYDTKCSADGYFSNERTYQVHEDQGIVKGESSFQGLQNLTRISTSAADKAIDNVHSGAPPPWFEATEESQINVQRKPTADSLMSLNKSGKSKKLNPKRVGAAWAEKRKIELEMEKRGEIVNSDCTANWLPNFGRVWQSGSRKESRKEFMMEKQEFIKPESKSEMPVKIQPYVSKRMVSSKFSHATFEEKQVNDHIGDTNDK
ncbi:TITAN-like protein isoform X1 [Carya illinoinensis]|uniref:TITAN-like protein isoform X1 n=1 Tax=Carya illinoinensis TaxID=32201 RepID=UPI001C719B49|nr:TITAN-like protein isoform X1 [Carya illinoinensis]